ncbi:tol-pal system protein YbgF [Shewanella avicenniae]|uniref:Cell division coordinator CpoB n=1 Tax=Shewanella avicenniae TaxID=2814294 RepID=A0ABX7QUJ7_9GAMM|nr:tol-pal system protein YbgF [Shewanella avicenniae]QSX35163.1 tol-pal system protein YbgF [Shewanella avicenniae]
MKKSLIAVALLLTGAAQAAPAPVEEVGGGGSAADRIARLERIIKARQQSEVDMQQRLDALQQEVLDLRGLTEQQNYQIQQMLQRQRQLYDEITKATSSQPAPSAAVAQPSVTAPAATATSSLSETDSYQQAVDLVLKQRKYDEAIPAFKSFISQYPNSNFADNANYWLGQLLYNQGDTAQAKLAFENVVTNYKESGKRPDSLVKLAMIAEKSNDKNGARNLYNQVLREYANSAAARIAQQQLAAIKP